MIIYFFPLLNHCLSIILVSFITVGLAFKQDIFLEKRRSSLIFPYRIPFLNVKTFDKCRSVIFLYKIIYINQEKNQSVPLLAAIQVHFFVHLSAF